MEKHVNSLCSFIFCIDKYRRPRKKLNVKFESTATRKMFFKQFLSGKVYLRQHTFSITLSPRGCYFSYVHIYAYFPGVIVSILVTPPPRLIIIGDETTYSPTKNTPYTRGKEDSLKKGGDCENKRDNAVKRRKGSDKAAS